MDSVETPVAEAPRKRGRAAHISAACKKVGLNA